VALPARMLLLVVFAMLIATAGVMLLLVAAQ
jgi:hypothetical protein